MTKREQERRERLMPNGVPHWIRCYDNGGETIDRYTVVYTGNYRHKTGGEFAYLAMNAAPFHPQGFGQHGSSREQVDSPKGKWPPAYGRKCHLGMRIPFGDLPPGCQRLVLDNYRELWDLNRE